MVRLPAPLVRLVAEKITRRLVLGSEVARDHNQGHHQGLHWVELTVSVYGYSVGSDQQPWLGVGLCQACMQHRCGLSMPRTC